MAHASRLAKNDPAMRATSVVRMVYVPPRANARRMKTAPAFRIAKAGAVWNREAVKPLWIAWAIECAQ